MIITLKSDQLFLEDSTDPSCFVLDAEGSVFAYLDDMDEDHTEIARFKLKYLEVENFSQTNHPFDLFDLSRETLSYFDVLYDSSPFNGLKFKPKVANALTKMGVRPDENEGITRESGLDLLIIQRIEIIAQARGTGLAELVINHAETVFGRGKSITALNPQPLTYENEDYTWVRAMEISRFKRTSGPAKKSIARNYERMGFSFVSDNAMVRRQDV